MDDSMTAGAAVGRGRLASLSTRMRGGIEPESYCGMRTIEERACTEIDGPCTV